MKNLLRIIQGVDENAADPTYGGPLQEGEVLIGELNVFQRKLFYLYSVRRDESMKIRLEMESSSEAHKELHRKGPVDESVCQIHNGKIEQMEHEYRERFSIASVYHDLFWSVVAIEHGCFSTENLRIREGFQLVSSPSEEEVRMPDFGGDGLMTVLMGGIVLDLFGD